MKTYCCFLLLVFPVFHNLDAQKPSPEHTLEQLQKAVNHRDFTRIEPYLAENYNYRNITGPVAVNILRQVITQFPRIDSIVIIQGQKSGTIHILQTRLYAANGNSDKEIILNADHKVVQADIAGIAMQGHGEQSIYKERKDRQGKAEKRIIPFRLTETGHIIIAAKVNGKAGNFMVDSGTAGNLMLNTEFSSYDSVSPENELLGVSGSISGGSQTAINSFEWAGLEYSNLQAMTANLEHLGINTGVEDFAGTIGYGILKEFIIEFDYGKQQLILWKDTNSFRTTLAPSSEQTIPFTMAYHLPVIEVGFGNHKVRLAIDCGAQGNMMEKKWSDLLNGYYSNARKDKLIGADNNAVEVTKVAMKTVSIGSNTYEFDFIFADLFGGAHEVKMIDGLIGYPFLSAQRTAINFRDQELYMLN